MSSYEKLKEENLKERKDKEKDIKQKNDKKEEKLHKKEEKIIIGKYSDAPDYLKDNEYIKNLLLKPLDFENPSLEYKEQSMASFILNIVLLSSS